MPKILPVCKENYQLVKNPCKCVRKTIKKKTTRRRTKKETNKFLINVMNGADKIFSNK